MARHTFTPNPLQTNTDWGDPSIWSGNAVPDSPDADVVIPLISYGPGVSGPLFTILIKPNEDYETRSVSLASNTLVVQGMLSVAGALSLDGGAIYLAGGTVSAGSVQVSPAAATVVQEPGDPGAVSGSGQITSAGDFNNKGVVSNYIGDLAVSAATFENSGGTLVASHAMLMLMVTGGAGAFDSLSGTTLTAGTYKAEYNGALDLNVGGIIVTDAANIETDSSSAIRAYDAASGRYVPLADSLRTIR